MSPDHLSDTFSALADPTRRAILARLASGEASVNELLEPFSLSQPAISKHLQVLERAGLISRSRVAQRRPCKLEAQALKEAADWIEHYRRFFTESFDRLDDYLREFSRTRRKGRQMMANDTIDVRDREIVGTRIFDAPRELVWRAFTDPDHLQHWWGPKGFTNTFHEFDFRPGGAWRFIMHGPDGTDYKNENRFIEIAFLERIVFDHLLHPKFRLTASFEDLDGKTKLTWRQLFESAEVCESVKPYAVPGLAQNLDKLAAHLPSIDPMRRALTIRRTFDAPRALVWQAWTDPKRLAHWWGPHGFTNPICEVDTRPGGAIYIVMRAPDGTDYPMRGVFREVIEPERLVFTNLPVDAYDRPMIDGETTVTFKERGGKTEMTLHTRAVGLVPQAAYMIVGMGEGWSQSIERLGDLLAPRA